MTQCPIGWRPKGGAEVGAMKWWQRNVPFHTLHDLYIRCYGLVQSKEEYKALHDQCHRLAFRKRFSVKPSKRNNQADSSPKNSEAICQMSNNILTDPVTGWLHKQHVRSGFIVALPKNRSANILNSLDELSAIWQKINDFRFEDDDQLSYSYKNVCVVAFELNKEKMICMIMEAFLAGKPRLEKHRGETVIVSAEALLFVYQLKFSTSRADALARKWEVALELIINNNPQNLTTNFDLYPYTSETLVTAAEQDTKLLSKLFAPMSLAVTLFTVGCCFVNNMLRSKPLLGLTGIISAALSIVASMGLLLLCGLQVTSLAYAMPFLIFGKFYIILKDPVLSHGVLFGFFKAIG
uniref:SSD domain-containing protein n=1 Tax=Romanomermis culicivorax TaxID=13658 RepID=A0A915HUW1_ROMCU